VVCASAVCAKRTYILLLIYVNASFFSPLGISTAEHRSRVIRFIFFCFLFFSFPGLSERQICWRCRGGSCGRGGHCPAIFRIIIYILILYNVDGIGTYKDGRRAKLNASRGHSNPAGDETTAASSPRAQHHIAVVSLCVVRIFEEKKII